MKIQKDKYLHFLVCLGICLLLYPLIGWWSIGTAIATGIGKELYDYKDYGLFSWSDIVADLLGTICSIPIILIINSILS